MKVQTLVKLTDTKDGTNLYTLFCSAVKGGYLQQAKGNSSDIAHLESMVSEAFDEFANRAFQEGVKYQKSLNK